MLRRDLLATSLALPALNGLTVAATLAPPPAPRSLDRLPLDSGWRFALGHALDPAKDFGFGEGLGTYAKQGPKATPAAEAAFDDKAWKAVELPHDWAVELPFADSHFVPPRVAADKPWEAWDPAAEHGYKPLGRAYPDTSVGWYRRLLPQNPDWRTGRVVIDFDGVFRACHVIVNGYILKHHEGGYVPFSVDVTDFLNTDDSPNVLLVRVDATEGEGWFYEGAGIYRHVWLRHLPPVHIIKDGIWVRPGMDGTVEVTVTVFNSGETAADLGVQVQIDAGSGRGGGLDFAGQSLTQQIATGQTAEVHAVLKLGKPHLWSVEDPHLYRATVTLSGRDHTADQTQSVDFGFRSVRFDADQGFFLNDTPLKLKGTCNHQDHAGVGAAIPDALQIWRIQTLKDMGCNAYRTSHNPPTPELLEACDRLGMLVIDETRMMTSSEDGLGQLETLIKRDRNHPSVIAWSIGNEEPQQGTARGLKIARAMRAVCKRLDPDRAITAAMDNGHGDGITAALDVIGFNYRDAKIDAFHAAHPGLPIIGTETASTVATRGEYRRDEARHIVPAYDTDAPWWATTAEGWWPHFADKPYIGGGFIWTGFDYRGEPTPYNSWPSISSQFGAMDVCGFPKDNYYYYRAWWRPEPLLHLFPHWNWEGEEGRPLPVWVHANCESVELFVNGVSAGRKTVVPNRHLEWAVTYQPGRITAIGYKGNAPILKAERRTSSKPAKIALSADRVAAFDPAQPDIVVVKAEILDAQGVAAPRADALIRFGVSDGAKILGVGNGNPNSLEADKASARHAFNGLACAIIAAPRGLGPVVIRAESTGLKSGLLSVVAKS